MTTLTAPEFIAATLPEPTVSTPTGTRVRVAILVGYVPPQNRPYPCGSWAPDPNNRGHYSGGCKCGRCDGTRITVTGTYAGTTYWADNSVDGLVWLDEPLADGCESYTVLLVAPHGDVCF